MSAPKDDNGRKMTGTFPTDPESGTVAIPNGRLERMSDAIEAGHRLALAGAPINPLETGFSELDAGLGSLAKKQFTMLAGDSGIGKSTVSTQAALHSAATGHGVVYLNLEMSQEMYGLRTLANYSRLSVKAARSGKLEDDGNRRMIWGAKELRSAAHQAVLGNAREHRTIPGIKALCVAAKQALAEEGTPLGLVIVDHVLKVLVNVRNDKDAEGKARADLLKEIADVFDVHVLALVHVTREGSKTGKMPTKNDMASSAWFDRDADNILVFHQKRAANGTFANEKALLACQKARWGDPFAVELEYQGGFFYPWIFGTNPRVTT